MTDVMQMLAAAFGGAALSGAVGYATGFASRRAAFDASLFGFLAGVLFIIAYQVFT